MRSMLIVRLVFLLTVVCLACAKEKQQPVVTLHVQLENRPEEVEWMEVQGSRKDETGLVWIDAQGYNAEHFVLNLQNIRDTGIVPGITIGHLSFSDGLGFEPKNIQSGTIKIIERNPQIISGTFGIFFQDNTINTNTVKVAGSFRILGKE